MIGANLYADLSSLYSLHAPRTAATKQKRERLSSFPFCTPSGARRLLATSPRECRSRHLWRCGSTTEVTLPKFESTNGVDCFGADVVLQQQNMSRVMIGANLCAGLSSLYSLHAPRAAAPKQKRERYSSFPFRTPSGARTLDPNIKSVVLYQLS